MNKENLQRVIKMLKGMDVRLFSMEQYRNTGSERTQKCGTVGCIIGHATQLDTPEHWEKFILRLPVFKSHFSPSSEFDFTNWSYSFFGLDASSETDMKIWDYLFDSRWGYNDILETNEILNSPKHAMYRINKVLGGYIPGDIETEIQKESKIIEESLVVSE